MKLAILLAALVLSAGNSALAQSRFTQYGGAKGAADALADMIAERTGQIPREKAAADFPPSTPMAHRGTSKLMLFGGDNHTEYLGCLNCGEYASDSIFNMYGRHGSPHASASITNKFGRFGSEFSTHSACSPYASNPPVVVDGRGNFYGALTLGFKRQINNPTLIAWLAAMCNGQ